MADVSDTPPPPALDAAVLRHALTEPGSPWRHLDVVASTGSTNADLLARASVGDDIDGAVLIAEHQTAGRGRNGRAWSSPQAQIAMSLGLAADAVPSDAWGWVPLAAGVAVVDAVAAATGVQAGLKWPNDILARDSKLAGILTEVAAEARVVVVGIGLNVTLDPGEVADADATSLRALGVESPDRNELVRAMVRECGTRLAAWRDAGGADERLIADYRARSVTIGQQVRAILPGGRELLGVARDIDEHGRLHIDSNDGSFAVSAGDIVHLRAAPES